MNFQLLVRKYPTEGNLVYKYSPLRNYRITEGNHYIYKNRLYNEDDLLNLPEFENVEKNSEKWPDNLDEKPILVEPGQLTDFETDELSFSLNHPVDIEPQYSYDNSVNLIINDGKNLPRLINTRFSPIGKGQYQIVDRKGDNDSNIYDQGSEFNLDTSLYKNTVNIPELYFLGISYGGNLSIGNYHFYFRYLDDDGNETDFVSESGLVSIFIGSTPDSVHTGFREQNSSKLVRFLLNGIDSSYKKVKVYYSRATSDIYQNSITSVFSINQDYLVTNNSVSITITGFEEVTELTTTDINPMYQVYGSAATQATSQNMLFLANLNNPNIDYEDLQDISLRIVPKVVSTQYDLQISETYNIQSPSKGYYDPTYIYNKTGYWDDELYRFGIVYILSNNTLSPVFNIRGYQEYPDGWENKKENKLYIIQEDDEKDQNWKYYWKNKTPRNTIPYNESDYLISRDRLENTKGVLHIPSHNNESVIGIKFEFLEGVFEYLKEVHKIKGFFFVRQRRIPTTLCQAYTIGVDSYSNTPVLPIIEGENYKYIAESFLSTQSDNEAEDRILTHDFEKRKRTLEEHVIRKQAAICPEYDINSPYFNNLFTGTEFVISPVCSGVLSMQNNHFYLKDTKDFKDYSTYSAKILGVEDNVKLVAINDYMFSARAGEAEEAFRYSYLEYKNKDSKCDNIIRGSYGPYLAIVGYPQSGHIVRIKIPGYDQNLMLDYFKIRYNDNSSFFAISDRFDLNKMEYYTVKDESTNKCSFNSTFYRGDCYICQFTHRLNRNFQDPSSPINDDIVDEKCWAKNYKVEDGVVKKESFDKINLGDVNAVQLGMYVTITIRSTSNLNIRSLDDSIPDEISLIGHSRGFYPYFPMNNTGSFKTPEALCYNKGFDNSVSERYNFEVPNVPAVKNDFTNRISYSNVYVTDAFRNNFRVFEGQSYRDYPKTYGQIIKLVELNGDLVCVFEHGVALIPINERAVAGKGSGGLVYINTSNVLPENPKIISDVFGSQWKESIIKTPKAIYGIDTIGKKIWRTNGSNFEIISDFNIQEFLNNNISLLEQEKDPIIGVRNVKTHYNRFKGDVIFTFYDNLHGFEEKAWSICYNETMDKWITFYSWIPSYSENIYNQFFTFDRNTSKYIAKLGVSKHGNDFSDGITISDNIIKRSKQLKSVKLQKNGITYREVGELNLDNRYLPEICFVNYYLQRDNNQNYKHFIINDGKLYIEDGFNPDSQVIQLNIMATITEEQQTEADYEQMISSGYADKVFVQAGYYQSSLTLIYEDMLHNLTTDIWKHGQAGIIDNQEEILPTHWYGKQHPFEFEFVVASNPDSHKVFDNLQIISNKAEPESFHYEIVGECYDFAKDKKNMYIRQEATKELYQYNGSDIVFNYDYKKLASKHRPLSENSINYDKSTVFPLYYSRQDTINEIEDYYHLYTESDNSSNNGKNFSALAGAEIVYYKNLDEYRIWNHSKAVNTGEFGLLRGNMHYTEDKWYVQINPINFVQKNEKENDWLVPGETKVSNPPIIYNLFPLPGDISNINSLEVPNSLEKFNVGIWGDMLTANKEVKPKDKYIKIKIRYSGQELAIISAIRTLFSISYAK